MLCESLDCSGKVDLFWLLLVTIVDVGIVKSCLIFVSWVGQFNGAIGVCVKLKREFCPVK